MTDLAQIALEFCRECLGWKNPTIGRSKPQQSSQSVWAEDHLEAVDFTDLNAVMEAVHAWCRENSLRWHVLGNDRGENRQPEFLAFVLPHDDYWEGRCRSDNLAHALLTACIEANRKMKHGE